MKKTIIDLLKESDSKITDKEIKSLDGCYTDFASWVAKFFVDGFTSPLDPKIIQAFWEMHGNHDIYFCAQGRVILQITDSLTEAMKHIGDNHGPERVNDFVKFVKTVEREYPNSIKMISPDDFVDLFENEDADYFNAVINRGDSDVATINITTRQFIEKIIFNFKLNQKEITRIRNFN